MSDFGLLPGGVPGRVPKAWFDILGNSGLDGS